MRKKSLWASVIRTKYECGREDMIRVDKDKQGSNFWRGLCKTRDMFKDNVVWHIGNGYQIRFWLDERVPNQGKLLDKATY